MEANGGDGGELFEWDLEPDDDDALATHANLPPREGESGESTGPSAPTSPRAAHGPLPPPAALPAPASSRQSAPLPDPPRPPRPPTRSMAALPPMAAPPRASFPSIAAIAPSAPTLPGLPGLPGSPPGPLAASGAASVLPPIRPPSPSRSFGNASYSSSHAQPLASPAPPVVHGAAYAGGAAIPWEEPDAWTSASGEIVPSPYSSPGPHPHGPSPYAAPPQTAPPQAYALEGQPLLQQGYAHPPTHTQNPFHIVRGRAYSFALDARGLPIELGSGRFAKAYLGEERWLESKTDYRRDVVVKILQKGVSDEDHMRFQMEKELLERVQGHPNIVELLGSGEGEESFVPAAIRDLVEPEFMLLERLEMSLEERLKGSRTRGQKDDLLAVPMTERVFRVLDYMIPVASAIEYAHLVRNICHRDLKPANVLVKLPDPNLRGSVLEVRLADFNAAKLNDSEIQFGMTQMRSAVPGTLFFQSPEQETNVLEMLVNVQQGAMEVEFFEDFYIQIAKNDTFSLWNHGEPYPIAYADRARKRLVLSRPYRDVSETNVRARIQKAVGRPADIYSLGAMLYYLISGAYANPKTLYDAFHKFVDYEGQEETNTIESYLQHEYGYIESLRTPKMDGSAVAPADRFFTYKHYLDGNGELIDGNVMLLVAKCMIRNKPDSYCQPHDMDTTGISALVQDLIALYSAYGRHAATANQLGASGRSRKGELSVGESLQALWGALRRFFTQR